MPIKAIPSAGGTIRALQTQLVEVGRIRLGTFNGKYPEKLDRFRFTSPDGDLIAKVAELYGGTPAEWTPQGGSGRQWEVVSETNRIPVYIPQQLIDPWNELWAAGRTCVRRCDGEREIIKDEPCVCATGTIKDSRQLCKPTLRVQLMLVEVPGFGSWRLETHGTYAVARWAMIAPLIARIPMPLPAFLGLKEESRRLWNAEKGKFDSRTWYVPEPYISAVTAEQIAIGGDVLTQALTAAGAPAALGSAPAAIAAEPARPPAQLDEATLTRILAAVEKANTIETLDALRAAFAREGVHDQRVKDSWASKRAAVEAAAEIERRKTDHQAESPFPKAAQPCNDPFCGGENGGCGWTVKEHTEFHGRDLIKNMPPGMAPVVPATAERVYVPEVVELPEPERAELPLDAPEPAQVKPAPLNLASERSMTMAAAGTKGWTTTDTLAKLAAHASIASGMKASAVQLKAFREAVESGEVT